MHLYPTSMFINSSILVNIKRSKIEKGWDLVVI